MFVPIMAIMVWDSKLFFQLLMMKMINCYFYCLLFVYVYYFYSKLVQLIKETDFYGVSGHIKFRGGPSRTSIINIMQWYDNETHVVGQFFPYVRDDSPEFKGGNLVFTNHSQIRWFTPDNKRPDDGTLELTACKLRRFADMLNVDCDTAFIVLNIIVGFIFIVVLIVIVFIIKYQYEKKVRLTQKYMKSLGLDINSSTVADLDKWEIPRECVCINRKLGEGAFGTVYGGIYFLFIYLHIICKSLLHIDKMNYTRTR